MTVYRVKRGLPEKLSFSPRSSNTSLTVSNLFSRPFNLFLFLPYKAPQYSCIPLAQPPLFHYPYTHDAVSHIRAATYHATLPAIHHRCCWCYCQGSTPRAPVRFYFYMYPHVRVPIFQPPLLYHSLPNDHQCVGGPHVSCDAEWSTNTIKSYSHGV